MLRKAVSNIGIRAFSNIAVVYCGYLFRMMSPLVVVPAIAKSLGPNEYSLVLLASALGAFSTLIVEFGFPNSGPREVIGNRTDIELVAVLGGVTATKIMMTIPVAIITLISIFTVPEFSSKPIYALAGSVSGTAIALNFNWFFQGRNQIQTAAIFDFLAAFIYITSVYLIVPATHNGILVLLLQATAYIISGGAAYLLLCRRLGGITVNFGAIPRFLRKSFALFLTRAMTSIYASASVLLLGILSAASEVAYYGATERLAIAAINIAAPLGQVAFPLVVERFSISPRRANQVVFSLLSFLLPLAVAGATFMTIFRASIVTFFFGRDYLSAASSLVALSWMVVFAVFNQVTSTLVLIIRRLDRVITIAVFIAAVVNIFLAIAFCPKYGATGMAISRLISEATVSVSMAIGFWLSSSPFRIQASGVQPIDRTLREGADGFSPRGPDEKH